MISRNYTNVCSGSPGRVLRALTRSERVLLNVSSVDHVYIARQSGGLAIPVAIFSCGDLGHFTNGAGGEGPLPAWDFGGLSPSARDEIAEVYFQQALTGATRICRALTV